MRLTSVEHQSEAIKDDGPDLKDLSNGRQLQLNHDLLHSEQYRSRQIEHNRGHKRLEHSVSVPVGHSDGHGPPPPPPPPNYGRGAAPPRPPPPPDYTNNHRRNS